LTEEEPVVKEHRPVHWVDLDEESSAETVEDVDVNDESADPSASRAKSARDDANPIDIAAEVSTSEIETGRRAKLYILNVF
jgi:hypothetical protein